jgi:molecular chaperone HtpG
LPTRSPSRRRRAGDAPALGVRWPDGGGEFDIEPLTGRNGYGYHAASARRPDDLLSGTKLRSIIRKYRTIVQPILGRRRRADGKSQKTDEDETVNQASALWARPKSEITDDQYKEFYKHVGHDFDDPLAWTHARVEGRQEYTELLYIPAHAPFDLWDRSARHGIRLYVRRVFIMDDAEQLLPSYLRFVRGIVDSNDLPLNVSREILQESRDIERSARAARRRCSTCSLGWHPAKRTSTRRSGRNSAASSRKVSARTSRTRRRSPACCASHRRTRTRRTRRCRSPTMSRG